MSSGRGMKLMKTRLASFAGFAQDHFEIRLYAGSRVHKQ